MKQLINDLHSSIPILHKIADGRQLSFDEAWELAGLYNRNNDTERFDDYIEATAESDPVKLRDELVVFRREATAVLNIYKGANLQFKAFDAKVIYKKHLEPLHHAYEQAQEVSAQAYKDYKELDNSLDTPEVRYNKEELPRMWELHAQKKEYSDKCSEHTKQLFEEYDKERRRTSSLFGFKLSAYIMFVFALDETSKDVIADLDDIIGKEDKK